LKVSTPDKKNVFYQHFSYCECLFILNSDSSDELGIRVKGGEDKAVLITGRKRTAKVYDQPLSRRSQSRGLKRSLSRRWAPMKSRTLNTTISEYLQVSAPRIPPGASHKMLTRLDKLEVTGFVIIN